jgi:peptide/nickel transport system ATP-binding protein
MMSEAVAGGSELLSVEHLEVELPAQDGYVRVIDDVSFTIGKGEMIGLAGESGSGKTMTALAIMGLLPSRSPRATGRIVFEGTDLLGLSKRERQTLRGSAMSMVFQEPMTSLHPAFTVGEQIAEVVRAHQHASRSAARARAVEMLDIVGIPGARTRVDDYPYEFSGGMQQRVMIAMALVCSPRLLIADEPTTALDVTVQAQIIELLKDLQRDFEMAVLFITHDLGVLAQLAERMMVMYAGQVVENAAVRTVLQHPLHPYSAALIRAAPHPSLKGERLPTIPGTTPRPGRFAHGCRFAPRCTFALDICRSAEPALESMAGHEVRCVRHAELELLVSAKGAPAPHEAVQPGGAAS